MSTAKFDTLQNAAGSLSVPVATVVNGSAKAWVNFNGTGTVAIRAGFNVSSITDSGTGNYVVNLTTALADVNYVVAGTCFEAVGVSAGVVRLDTQTTTTCRVFTHKIFDNGVYDSPVVTVAIFR